MACPRPDERPLRPSRPSRRLSRRDLLVWSGQVPLAAVALSSCSFLSTEPNTDKRSDTDPTTKKGKEAPRLAAEVKAGRLPPVAERLPKKPLVVEPVERMGVYGGEWNTAVLGAADGAWLYRTIGYEHLVNWDRGWTEPIPNIAESLEVEDDGRRFVFHLREGMRWSDGEPFTADDVVFAYDDVLMYEELSPQPPAWLVTDGNPGTIEKIDDFTVQFEFSAPNGLFLENIAQPAGEGLTNKPKHYLSKFHKKYVDNVDELAKKEKHADWLALFWAKASPFDYVGLPRITPWLITTPLGKGSRVVAERNPYYWKTDPDGSQLPYIDRIVYQVINDAETMTLAATSGAYDMHERHITTAQNKPVLARGREKGNYHFVEEIGSSMNSMVIALNLTHKDKVLRDIFRNKDFRIGLSHAINRPELIEAVFQRQGEPWQAAPRPEAEFHDEEFAKQYTEYDVDLANQHLDKAGLTQRDDAGYRLRPDGKRLSFQLDVASGIVGSGWTDAADLVSGHWKVVGVEMRVNTIDRSLLYERKDANAHDANVWGGDGGMADAILDPRWYFPHSAESNYAPLWENWFNNASPKEEPPEATRRQMELYRRLLATPDKDGRLDLFRQILQIAKEQFYAIGTVLPPKGYAIVSNDFHNVPKTLLNGWIYPGPGPANPEQFFLQK